MKFYSQLNKSYEIDTYLIFCLRATVLGTYTTVHRLLGYELISSLSLSLSFFLIAQNYLILKKNKDNIHIRKKGDHYTLPPSIS